MRKPMEPAEDILDDELEDLLSAGMDLPASVQARWRRHDSLRKMPRERESGEAESRTKPQRVRRQTD
jgi:hypothetical protein